MNNIVLFFFAVALVCLFMGPVIGQKDKKQ